MRIFNLSLFISSALMAAPTTGPEPDCSCNGGQLQNGGFETDNNGGSNGMDGWKLLNSSTKLVREETYAVCGSGSYHGVFSKLDNRQTTVKVRVQGSQKGNWLKVDLACLQIVEPDPSLPVTLIAFDIKKENAGANLLWSTTAETNSRVFEIQHSNNGKNWNDLGSVDAKGESYDLVQYSYVHNNPLNGTNFYRLKMVDNDDNCAFSRIISVHFEIKDAILLYPNPTVDFLQINSGGNEIAKFQMYNNLGVLVLDVKPNTDNTVDVHYLKPGNYSVKISQANGSIVTKRIQIIR